MTTERREPFRQALVELRRRLRDGVLEPGARVTAKEVADGLKLSPTPVREALSRLAGEGLLEEHRGDGFFVPELSAADVTVLYRMSAPGCPLRPRPISGFCRCSSLPRSTIRKPNHIWWERRGAFAQPSDRDSA